MVERIKQQKTQQCLRNSETSKEKWPDRCEHSERRINAQPPNDAAADFRFDGQVGRRIDCQIDVPAAANAIVIENVVAFIGFQPFG